MPAVDTLRVRVLTDSSYDTPRPGSSPWVKVARSPFFSGADYRKALHNEWGLPLAIEPQAQEVSGVRKLHAAMGGTQLQAIFITLDPEHDTAAILRNYAAAFHPRLLALRGSVAETRAVARAYKVGYRMVAQAGSSVALVDHSAFVYVLDREGKYVAFFPPGTSAERMGVMVREVLEWSG